MPSNVGRMNHRFTRLNVLVVALLSITGCGRSSGSGPHRPTLTGGERVVVEFGARAVSPSAVYDIAADIFAPCALGASINSDTVPRLRVAIVAGAANNQIAEPVDGLALYRRGVLYAPDYVINAGGLINVSWDVLHRDQPYNREAAMLDVAKHETQRLLFGNFLPVSKDERTWRGRPENSRF